MYSSQQLNASKKSKSKPVMPRSTPCVVEYWGAEAGRPTRTVMVAEDGSRTTIFPACPSSETSNCAPTIATEGESATVSDDSSDSGSNSTTSTTSVLTIAHPQGPSRVTIRYNPIPTNDTTALLSRASSLADSAWAPGYGTLTKTATFHPHPIKLGPGVLHPHFGNGRNCYEPITTALHYAAYNASVCDLEQNRLQDLSQRQEEAERLHIRQGSPWLLTRMLWCILMPSRRRQYDAMSAAEVWAFRVLGLLLLLVLGAAVWAHWGDEVVAWGRGTEVVGLTWGGRVEARDVGTDWW